MRFWRSEPSGQGNQLDFGVDQLDLLLRKLLSLPNAYMPGLVTK